MFWEIVIVVNVFGISLYKWATKNFNYFKERGIAYKKPVIFCGNSKELYLGQISLSDFISKWYNEFPDEK